VLGKQFGHYRINLELGRDGLGDLYLVRHVAAGFDATLRHFNAEFADVAQVQRFVDIARAASALNHPGIFSVRDSVWSGRNAAVVGEPLPLGGETFASTLRRETRFHPEATVKMGWQLASAVAAAHSQNVHHGFLRPEGLWVHPDADAIGGHRAKVMDFGIAAFLPAGHPNFRSPRMEALGPPLYLSPEQCRAGMLDWRSDVYALGCVLFHMAAGRPPFPGVDPQQIAESHKQQPTRGPAAFLPEIPLELSHVVERMLVKEPSARPTMPEVAFELERIFRHYWPPTTHERTVQVDLRIGEPPPAPWQMGDVASASKTRRRRWPVVVGLGGLGLVGAGVALAIAQPWRAAPETPTPAVVAADPVAAPAVPDAAAATAPTRAAEAPPVPRRLSAKEQAIEDAKKALVEERWQDAFASAQKVQELEPDNRTAAILMKQARSEPANKRSYDELLKAIAAGDPKKAGTAMAKIPRESLYAKRAGEAWEGLRKEWLAQRADEARGFAAKGSCPKIQTVEKQVAEVFPDAVSEIQDIGRTCKK
jgi:eukaryotic-like serine/threonine-protein kinase